MRRSAFETEAPSDDVEQHSERVRGKLEKRHITVINNPHLLQPNLTDYQISHEVRECVSLSAPGPHVIILILQHHDFNEDDRIRVKCVLERFSDHAIKHTIVLTDEDSVTEEQSCDSIHQLKQECGVGHLYFDEHKSECHSEIFQKIKKILDDEEDTFIVCDLSEDLEVSSRHLGKADQEEKDSDCNEGEKTVQRKTVCKFYLYEKILGTTQNSLMLYNNINCILSAVTQIICSIYKLDYSFNIQTF